MLSEREQRTLDEIEMRLVIEDPRFCARMSRHRRARARLRFSGVFAYLGVLAVVTAASVSFASGLPALGFGLILAAVSVAAGYAVAAWQRRRHARRDGCAS